MKISTHVNFAFAKKLHQFWFRALSCFRFRCPLVRPMGQTHWQDAKCGCKMIEGACVQD